MKPIEKALKDIERRIVQQNGDHPCVGPIYPYLGQLLQIKASLMIAQEIHNLKELLDKHTRTQSAQRMLQGLKEE